MLVAIKVDDKVNMDILKSTYYIRCNKYLSFCGHWPYQKTNIKILHQTLIMTATMTVVTPQLAKLFELRHHFHYVVMGLPSVIYYMQFIFKSLFAVLRRKEIKQVLEKIKYDFQVHKGEDLKLLHDYSAKALKINTFYTVYMLMAVIAYSMLPLTLHLMDIVLPKNETRLAQKPRLIKFYIDRFDDNMLFIILHGVVVDTMAIVFIIGFDTLYFSFAHHACGLFVIVTNKMRDSIDVKTKLEVNASNQNFSKYQDILYQNFSETIIMHEYTLEFSYFNIKVIVINIIRVLFITIFYVYCRFVKTLESAFSSLNLFSIVCAMIPLTITGFEVIMYKSNFNEMVRYILFAVGEIVHLFYYNWPGQKIRDHSLLIYQSCYGCEWYKEGIPDKCKKLLSLMMLRSQKPCQLTAGKVYILGLENFAAVIKLSMSYFTVLSSLM